MNIQDVKNQVLNENCWLSTRTFLKIRAILKIERPSHSVSLERACVSCNKCISESKFLK